MAAWLTYDWSRLPSLRADDAQHAHALVRAADRARIDECAAHVAALLKVPVEVTHVDVGLTSGAFDGLVISDGPRLLGVSIDDVGCVAVVARLLGVAAPSVVLGAPGERARGAFAALVVATSRRIGATPRPFRVASNTVEGPCAQVTVHALVAADPVELRFVVPVAQLAGERVSDIASLGSVPLTLPLVVATAFALTHGELAALLPGRALVLGARAIGRLPLALVAPRSERGVGARFDVGAGGPPTPCGGEPVRVVVTGDAVASPLAMDPDSSSPLAETLREAELVVRVELSSVTLPVAAWASLAAGDVVTTDTPVGSAVVLRAGGVAFAEGELCELEGKLAVRITKRALSR